jgi:PAS domain S-box-containing protein
MDIRKIPRDITRNIQKIPEQARRMLQELSNVFLMDDDELRDSDNLLKSVLDSATEYAIIATDLDRNIITWNTGAEKIFGYTREEIIGKRKLSFLIPEQEHKSSETQEIIHNQLEGKGIWKGEALRQRRNGETFYARIIVSPLRARNKDVIGSMAIIRDITREKKLYQELESSKILNDAIINGIPLGLVVLDRENRIIETNESFIDLTGSRGKDVKGSDLCKIMGCLDGPEACENCGLKTALKKVYKSQNQAMELEQELTLRPAGRKLTRFFLIRIIKIQINHLDYLLVIFSDFTDRRRLQLENESYMNNLKEMVDQRTGEIQKTSRQLMQDLEAARLIQRSLLKNSIREIPGYKYFYKFYPSKLIGGDFFTISRLTDDLYYFYICDVSGHGVPAAMLTVFFQQTVLSTVRGMDPESFSPGTVLTQVNKAFLKEDFTGMPFVTAFFGSLDLKNHTMKYAVAGHHNAIVFNKGSKDVHNIGYFSKPLGVLENSKYRDQSVNVAAGDNIFLFTDGLIEIFDRNGKKAFSVEQLFEFVQKNVEKSEQTLIKSLIDHIRSLHKSNQFEDDVAVLNIKREK